MARTVVLLRAYNNADSVPPFVVSLRKSGPIYRTPVSGLQVAATGGTGVYTNYAATNLAGTGLSINAATGAITGTPTTIGTIFTTITVTDSSTATSQGNFVIVVQSRLTLLTPNPLYGAAETNCVSNYQVLVSGATGAVTFTTASNGGLSLSAAGVITAPTVNFTNPPSGTAILTTTATDAGTGDTLPITLCVDVRPRPTATNSAKGIVATYATFWPPQYIGIPYSIPAPVVSGGTPPYTFVDLAGNLAAFGLTVDPSTGAIAGTATSLNAAASGYQSGIVIGVGIKDKLFTSGSGNGSISGNLAQFLPNNSIQPKKNGVSQGNPGPTNFNFVFPDFGTPDVANDGVTTTVTIPMIPSDLIRARLATAAALPTNNYANGTSGVGATLTAVATGVLTVDGVNVALNDVVLVRNEATTARNGPYTCTIAGAVGVAYVLTRHGGMDESAEYTGSLVATGPDGTANKNSVFECTAVSPVTVGTTAITFQLIAGPGYVTNVTGTAPVVSSGGTTPAISMAAATTAVDGYLTHADWNTFNAKQGPPTFTTAAVNTALAQAGWNIVFVNANALTITLPAAPNAGDEVDFLCAAAAVSLTVNPNGLKIETTAGNMTCDLKKPNGSVMNFSMIYTNAAEGWSLI